MLFMEADRFLQGNFLASALFCSFSAGVVHKDLAHQAGRDTKKMRSALPRRVGLIDEANISLVNQRRRLQRVSLAFFAKVTGGKLTELAVDQGRQVIQRPLVPLGPFRKQ